MSGQPTTQMQISEWDPENLNSIKKSIKWSKNEFSGNWRSKIGFILTLFILMMTLCIFISVAFCQHEQNKMEQMNEFKHNLTLQSSMNSVKVRFHKKSPSSFWRYFLRILQIYADSRDMMMEHLNQSLPQQDP